ncbi:MAG TPA: PEP-CTERM sorting domain-containing protein, partial [Phycisphaerales bacterium]|nr:PEP-CTERM sorting domain-containing protein [Phycisphaerales bacterium]
MNGIDGFKISLVLLVFVSFVCLSQANTVSFQGLGDLPGGGFWSNAVGVSADGSVVVGRGFSASGFEAFRWENGVMIGLGDLPGDGFYSNAFDVSANGSVVVGIGGSDSGPEAFRWTAGGGMVGLGDLP